MGESICTPRPNTKTERRQTHAGADFQDQISPRQKGLSDIGLLWRNREKERKLMCRDYLQCVL